VIHVDPRNPTAQSYAAELAHHLPEGWTDAEVHLVIGGDGFLLHTAAAHQFRGTWLGLNAGRIGFLLNDVSVWEATVDLLRRHQWTVHSFPLLEARATDGAGVVHTALALNDVVLERTTGQTAHLAFQIDGRSVVDPLVADGIIFATALGSTAYTFSAGGPACHPTLDVLAVTAICPHKPRLAPLVLPPGTTATVDVLSAERRPVRCATDGRHLDDIRHLEVSLSRERVRIAWLAGQDLTSRMVSKILRP
jgi:NAD+ kinase